MTRVIIFTGKGGVGKSVISAATALELSEQYNYDVALISTDPAHTISHYLDIKTISNEVRITSKLILYYIDPVQEMFRKFRTISEHLVETFKKYGIDDALAYELAMLPMVTESTGIFKVVELYESGKFDIIIMDTIPSAEALRLLYLPRIVNSVHKRLVKVSFSALKTASKILSLILSTASRFHQMVEEEEGFFNQIERAGQIFENPDITSVRVIANPDTSSIDDAIKTTGFAQIFGLNVDLGILNKYLPENVGTYFSKWIEEQEKYVRQFETSLYPIPIRKLPIFEIELKGFEMLRKAAKLLYENEDPSKVFHRGKIMEIKDIGDKYILEMNLPDFVNDCKDIILHGDELIIVLETDRGVVDKVLPLPTILRTTKPETAYLEGRRLVVEFRKQLY